ncbi:DUF2855 family protein [Marinobacteraceae bacterium S3BR75-40.1]
MDTHQNSAVDFLVNRQHLRETRFATSDADHRPLQEGEVRLRIERFALTANNITYAVFGDQLNYWSLFPAPEPWGRVPVWGFADVVESTLDHIVAGERLFGFMPISSHLIVQPGKVSSALFVDEAPGRDAINEIYNQYVRVSNDPHHQPDYENLMALFRPLFTSAFLLAHDLKARDYAGADALILSSASSKTAFGTAFQLHRNRESQERPELIALTSRSHRLYVASLGCYDRVLSYDEVDELDPKYRYAYVDFSGDSDLRRAVHARLQDQLTYSGLVGAAHWDKLKPDDNLPGPEPALFFAPSQAQQLAKEWGRELFQRRLMDATADFLGVAAQLIRVSHYRGEQAVEEAFLRLLAGQVAGSEGMLLSL